MKIVICNSNPIHKKIEQRVEKKYDALIITKKEDLDAKRLSSINPKYIFFFHWSFFIPAEIYENYECIVFHMTDLPYGRGGSPLQNLILRGHTTTKISALRVAKGIDTGDIYLKSPLSLLGTAEEIFLRSGEVMAKMVDQIIELAPIPQRQVGEAVTFKRRKPKDGNIKDIKDLYKVFDYIRMLDAEGYPKAFIETEFLRFEFSRVSMKKDKIIADVSIIKK